MRIAALAPVAVIVGITGAFMHRWASPLGLIVALGAAVGLAVLARAWARGRLGMVVIALLWMTSVMVIAEYRPGGDLVVLGDEAGLVFLYGGVISHGLAVSLGAEARSVRRVT